MIVKPQNVFGEIAGLVALSGFIAFMLRKLAIHNSIGLFLERDGFRVRSVFVGYRYRWTEVGPFVTRRWRGCRVSFQRAARGRRSPGAGRTLRV